MPHAGSCFCGAVKLKVTGSPEAMGYCHCKSCRSWSGGPVNAFSLWKPEAVRVTSGAEHVATFQKTELSQRQYRAKCGGHLMTNHPPLGLVDVLAATLPTLAFAPGVHVNYAETVLPMRDGLPKLKDFPAEFGGSGEAMAEQCERSPHRIGDSMISRGRLLLFVTLLLTSLPGIADTAGAQIVAIGASNVAGRGVSSSDAWPARLEGLLAARGRKMHVTNAGINGDTNAGMLARLDSAVPGGTKIVLLDKYGGGWNARRKGQGDQRAELAAIEARLRSRGIKVIPMWWNASLRNYLQPDGIHFTPEGHALVASRMLPSVIGAVR